jgi:hypothetical protein
MPQPIARLTSAGNFYVQGALDEATYDSISGYSKNWYSYSQNFALSPIVSTGYQPYLVSQWDVNSAIAPDGTKTAVTVSNIPNQNSSFSNRSAGDISRYMEVAGGTYTKSIYAKWISGSTSLYFQIIRNLDNIYPVSSFNLVTGATSGGTSTQGMIYVGNGWWRCWQTFTLPSGVLTSQTAGDSFFVGGYGSTNLLTTMQFWGLQFEQGALSEYEATGAQASGSSTPPFAATLSSSGGFTTRVDPTGFYTIGSLDEVSLNPTVANGTNLLAQSQTFASSAWSIPRSTVTLNAATAPDGTPTATLFTTSPWTTAQYIAPFPAPDFSISGPTTYTKSVYAKAGTVTSLVIESQENLGGANITSRVIYDLIAGTVSSGAAGQTASIQNVGNGWYRCITTKTYAGPGVFSGSYYIGNAYGGGPGGTIYLWGPQMERGSTATDYVPTGASSVPAARFVERKASTGLHRVAGVYDEVSLNPTSGYTKNILSYSQAFNQGSWLRNTARVLDNVTLAPDNTLTGSKLIGNTVISNKEISQGPNVVAGYTYTISGYFKAAEQTNFRLAVATQFGSVLNVGTNANFSLVGAGSAGTLSGGFTASSIKYINNGWFRCSATLTTVLSGFMSTYVTLYDSTNALNYVGDGISGIYIWGLQLEQGATATDYVATGTNAIPLT